MAVALAAAAWVAPGSVHIVAWSSGQGIGPPVSRIAYLPPLSRLWTAAAFTLAGLAIAAFVWRIRRRSLDDLSRTLAPLSVLWLWLLPYVPRIADFAPALIVFAGPAKWAVLVAGLGGMVLARRDEGDPEDQREHTNRASWPWRIDRRAVFAVSLVVYVTLGVRFAREVGYGGDEPHYLVIAHSLLVDRDLDIANNHEQRDYAAFFAGDLRPDFLTRGLHGEIYSIHAPGLPALLLPAYAIGGATGATIFVALIGALTALALFDLTSVVATPGAAFVAWLAVVFSVPFVPHAYLIYPEIAGALIVAWAATWLFHAPASTSRTALRGCALALLPWLHTKFSVLLALLTVFEAIRLWPRTKHVLALIAPVAVSGVLWLASFYWLYGTFNPEAPYGAFPQVFVLAKNIPRGLLGLLFDQKFGLLVYSPIYLLAVTGSWLMLRQSGPARWRAAALLTTTIVFSVSTTRMYMWWGGSSAPARFLVPIVPLLAPMIAAAIGAVRSAAGRAAVVVLVVATLGTSLITIGSPGESLLYSSPHGLASVLGAVQGTAPLDLLLPTFTEENWRAPILALLPWAAALALSLAGAALVTRARWIRSPYWIAVSGITVFVAIGSMAASRPAPAIREEAVVRGRETLLRDFDPAHMRMVDASRGERLDPARVAASTAVTLRRQGDDLAAPFEAVELPEGEFEALVWFDGNLSRPGELQLIASEHVVLARTEGALLNPARLRVHVPVSATVQLRLTDPGAASAVRQAQISAVSVRPRSERVALQSHGIEPLEGGRTGLIAYTDRFAYPEDGTFWTRGTAESTVAIVTNGASTLRLVLHVGPTGGPVFVAVGSRRFTVDLKANETRDLDISLEPGTRAVPISVRATRAFVPANVEKGNADRRSLGCQVRPVLS